MRKHSVESVAVRVLLAAAAGVAALLSLVRIFVFGSNQAYLDSVSGTWTALAVDLTKGVFYRPLLGPDGFGGTRYFPLHFILHATVIKVLGDPVRSGQFLAAFSVFLLALGVCFVVRAQRGAWLLAASSAAVVFASQTTQEALLSIKGDALPAALNVWGVALCAGQTLGPWQALGAAGLFTLAFASKPTAVYGVLATTLWLVCSKRGRLGGMVLSATAIGAVIVLASMYLASEGRAFEALWAGASTGVRLSDFLKAPLTLAQLARQVPETLVFIQLGLAAVLVLSLRAKSLSSLPVLFFLAALVVSVPIFAFEGTDTNHLIDLHVASVIAIAAFVMSLQNTDADFGVATLAVAALAGSLSLASGLMNRHAEQRQGTLEQALALIPDRQRPILAENPLVPIAAGQQPYMLDSYMFRLIRARNPSLGEPLRRALREQAFAAVVLERNPHDARGIEWYRTAFFGEDFVEELEQHYEMTGHVRMRVVYRPKPR